MWTRKRQEQLFRIIGKNVWGLAMVIRRFVRITENSLNKRQEI